MTDKATRQLSMKISDEILDLVDNAIDMPRGDVQGAAEAIAINVVNQHFDVEEAA